MAAAEPLAPSRAELLHRLRNDERRRREVLQELRAQAVTGAAGSGAAMAQVGALNSLLPLCPVCRWRSAAVRAQSRCPTRSRCPAFRGRSPTCPTAAVSVRLIRGRLDQQPARSAGRAARRLKVQTVKTDDAGARSSTTCQPARRSRPPPTVDGEHLESQEFPAPARAASGCCWSRPTTSNGGCGQPPCHAGRDRPGHDRRAVAHHPRAGRRNGRCLLPARHRERRATGESGHTVRLRHAGRRRQDRHPSGLVAARQRQGPRITVQGPFPPGNTFVQVGCELPSDSGTVEVVQRFPAALERVAVIVKKVGDMKLSSPQLTPSRT